ncbi:hypothetical protein R6Q57_013742 [Mikania cordata]
MFKFSCFHSPNHSLKPKKAVQIRTETMGTSLEDHNTNKPNKDPVFSKEVHQDNNVNPFPSAPGLDWKSEGLKSMNDTDSEHGHETMAMRKCMSLLTDLAAYQDMTSGEDSCSFYGNRSGDEYQKAQASVSPQISSNFVKHELDFSPDHLQQSDEEVSVGSEARLSGACTGGSSNCTPRIPHYFVKSNSLPYMHMAHTNVVHEARSSEARSWNDKSVNNDHSAGHAEKSDGDESYDYVGLAKDWIVPTVDEGGKGKSVQEGSSGCQYEELPNEDFKIKRIEKWVMDLQHTSLEETNMLTDVDHHGQNDKGIILDYMTPSRNDSKANLGMDAAKRYISSMNAAATTAQLANHGLVVIPFLSTFSSLRALNLSGNSIVRITVGALPRGLHILNLSKNSISIIEGLRDLTGLRVLDLSYNRILRIGHGLASCSSLKDLYLAGNKIGEVEGLHRLRKLNVLDLRFNKLSTTKNLRQLAANYSSLQAISLEGNPAQKSIGDEQLKKFLLGLLPHIAYFNRKSIKAGGKKDSAARIGVSSHKSDRGLTSKSKKSTHGRKSQVVGGHGRHARLPPSGIKAMGDRHRYSDVNSQLVSCRPDLAMRRAHSEGLLRLV